MATRKYRKKNIPYGSHVVTARDLKPEKEMSDAQLLAMALKEALEWKNGKVK